MELKAYIKGIETAGVKILSNETKVVVTRDGSKVALTGLDEDRYGLADIKKAAKGLGIVADDVKLKIGFGHNPDISLKLPDGLFDIFLCGHFHGGQIWTPFGFEFRTLRNETLCRKGKIRGLNIINGMYVYINRGLGNVAFPLRFRSKPELTVIYFTGKK